jgi:urocanate hydratase
MTDLVLLLMAIQNVMGDSSVALRVSIHNGGGVGWGEVINGGFGMVLDGSRSIKTYQSFSGMSTTNSRKKLGAM